MEAELNIYSEPEFVRSVPTQALTTDKLNSLWQATNLTFVN